MPATRSSPPIESAVSATAGGISELPANPEPTPNLPAAGSDQLDGAVGEALRALAHDLQAGKKAAETLVHIDPSGVLCLKWPDALTGCGLDSKAILDELSHRNWLALDPLAPFRKVTEIAVEHGQPWKVIRLQPAVKQLMAIGNLQPKPATTSASSYPTRSGSQADPGQDQRPR
ncbi:hypothetical protein [Candidatus Accumulibacter sp. ACC005]|uniref:hypothetical protein n=1 Tax=Candidatus Accumulibacter sp. ACC005 TaxID=2823331 RepID=UPI0025BFB39F|nr:hypothetical protein [Candidatus Accumulibacter sp. ACC005]